MQVTERDIRLLKEINRFGFVDIDYVAQQTGMDKKRAYRRLYQLKQNHYLLHETIFYQQPGIYRVTGLGVQLSQDKLPPLRKIKLANFHHDLNVAKLSLQLINQFQGEFISERELRQQQGITKRNQPVHFPDGVLKAANKKIAIEVELTPKSYARLEKIIRHYQKEFTMDEVWYYCGNEEVKTKLDKVAQGVSFIKSQLL